MAILERDKRYIYYLVSFSFLLSFPPPSLPPFLPLSLPPSLPASKNNSCSPHFSYHQVTKTRCSDKPSYDSLASSLQCMKSHIDCYEVRHLCMPRIGCGLDRLKWEKVISCIRDVFANADLIITIYSI